MRLIVSRKQFRQLQAAMLIRFFEMRNVDVVAALLSSKCKDCRKEHVIVAVMTVWYRRYERRMSGR